MIQPYTTYFNKNDKMGLIVADYTFYQSDYEEIVYKCCVKKCSVKAIIINDKYVEVKEEHINHTKTAVRLFERRKIISETKKFALNTFLEPNEILCEIHKLVLNNNIKEKQSDKHLRKIIKEARTTVIKETTDNCGINVENYLTIGKKKFIQYVEIEESKLLNIIVFNEENKIHVQNTKCIVGDGTFFSCPREFTQIYVLHCEVFGSFYPLVYLFLSSKSFYCYLHMLKKLKSILGFSSVKNIVLDFEVSAFKAFEECFSNADLYFCNFHMGQAIYRKIQKLGLVKKYEQIYEFRKIFKMILALAYEKPGKVVEKFTLLKSRIEKKILCSATEKFFAYFDNTYIGCFKKPLFGIKNWNTHNRILEGIPTTTNFAEAWNKDINFSVRTAHPSLNSFLKKLRTRDFLTTIKINENLTNDKKKICSKTQKLKEAVINYDKYYDLTFLFLISEIKDENF